MPPRTMVRHLQRPAVPSETAVSSPPSASECVARYCTCSIQSTFRRFLRETVSLRQGCSLGSSPHTEAAANTSRRLDSVKEIARGRADCSGRAALVQPISQCWSNEILETTGKDVGVSRVLHVDVRRRECHGYPGSYCLQEARLESVCNLNRWR